MKRTLLFLLLLLAAPLRAEDLRTHFVAGDYEAALRLFASLPSPAPVDRAFAAASGLQTARPGIARRELAILQAAAPDSPWRWFVEAALLQDRDRAAEAAVANDKAIAGAGADPDEELLRQRMFLLSAANRIEDARAVADAHPESLRLRATKAYLLTFHGKDDEAAALFESLRRDAPGFLEGDLAQGRAFLGRRRYKDAYPLLKKAAAQSIVMRVHVDYWRAIASNPELSEEQKKAELDADIAGLRTRRGELPEVHLAIATEYARRNDPRAAEWRERVLAAEPGTVYAARALWTRYTAFSKEHGAQTFDDPALVVQARDIVRDYLNYATDEEDAYRVNAQLAALAIAKRLPDTPPDELLAAARGVVQEMAESSPGHAAEAATALADRGVHLDAAEEMVRAGFESLKKMPVRDADEEEYAIHLRSWLHDALGWVKLKQGDVEGARNQLFAAYELKPDTARYLYHLGQWYEAGKELGKAEDRYRRGATLQSTEANPNEGALRALYEKRHGTLAGFEAYRKSSEKAEVVSRRSRILSERKKSPAAAPPFKLKTLDGKEVSLASLEGKTAVVNFWGIWCGWCVKEMPEYQQLAKKYANDPSVEILTINNDGDAAGVRKWMAAQKYDFAVLLDDGYVGKNKVSGFPTTWFLDPRGRIAFEKRGWTRKLVEEFSWRVEELKTVR